MKKFLITGGAGVIGLEIVPKLLARGFSVWVGDLKPKPASFDHRVEYRQGDLNTLTVSEVLGFSPDVIIHLAATFERSAETSGFWGENFLHNVTLSHHMMSIARDIKSLKRVVFASSYLIYDPQLYQFDSIPEAATSLKESDPILPRNLTGMAKLSHEIELRFLSEQQQTTFSIACLRIFRGYGRNSRDVISRWVRALLAGETIEVYNPEGVFDYLYARDSAEGLIRVCESPDITGIVNLGTGKARKVADVINILGEHFPAMNIVEHDNTWPLECSQADMSHWQSLIDWIPEYTLEKAIPEIIEYERAQCEADTTVVKLASSVLVTSASAKVPLIRAVKTSLEKLDCAGARCWAGDVDPDVLTRHVADEFWLLPILSELVLAEFIQGCRERNIGMIIPTRDGELAFWAQHKEALHRQGIEVLVSPLASVNRCLDKLAFSAFGVDKGLPFIQAAESIDGLIEEDTGEQCYTVKERFGAGSLSIGLNLTREQAQVHAKELSVALYQRHVTGREISVDAWIDANGQPKGVVMRWRDKVVNGESQVTTTFSHAALEAQFMQILKALDLRGPVVLQAIVDDAGSIHVIECNSRFGGASTLSLAAGLDSFYWSLLEAQGVNMDDVPFNRTHVELRQVRVPCDEIIHDSGV